MAKKQRGPEAFGTPLDTGATLDDIARLLETIIEGMRVAVPMLGRVATGVSPPGAGAPRATVPAAPKGASEDDKKRFFDWAAMKERATSTVTRQRVTQTASNFIDMAGDPTESKILAAMKAGPGLAGALGGIVSERFGDLTASAIGAIGNQLGGARERYTVEGTVQDMRSAISNMADMGISMDTGQMKEMAGAFRARRQFKFDQLDKAADAVDYNALESWGIGGGKSGVDIQARSLTALQQIVANTSKDGGAARAGELQQGG